MHQDQTGRAALITGAASGIGRDTARLFASAGWQCVLVDRNAEALSEVLGSLPQPAQGAHQARTIDLTDAAQIATLAEGLPALDALLNNAGMSDASNTPLDAQSDAQMARLMALNLAAPAAVVQACAARLRPGARIVNVSSGAGLAAIPWRGGYSPSKAGLIAQTRALAQAHPEWCVSVLAPGFVRTELVDGLIAAGRIIPERAVAKIPLGRMASPAEMAQALFFLGQADARPLSGEIMAFNGGSSIYGGSQAFAPAVLEPVPLDRPLQLSVVGDDAPAWQAIAPAEVAGVHYAGCLDLTPMRAAGGSLLQAVHEAARRFAAQHAQQASLALLLPAEQEVDWPHAGDAAAARMLVSTLACEWGARALRVNALLVPRAAEPQALHGLLRFMCGAAAQYLTGQTLVAHAPQQAPA
jgi:NAD(P)-dependent dehydrogenase (short-subunit alcohol dehydrogenase family)